MSSRSKLPDSSDLRGSPRRRLHAAVLAAACAGFSTAATAQDGASPTWPYVPALVQRLDSTLPEPVAARITEAVTGAVTRGVLESTAEAEYGANLGAGGRAQRGPAALTLASLRAIDARIDAAVRGDLAPDLSALGPDDQYELSLVVAWLPADPRLKDAAAMVLDGALVSGFGALIFGGGATPAGGAALTPTGLALIANTLPPMIVIDERRLPPGITPWQVPRDVYEWLAEGNIERFVPMRIELTVNVANRGLSVRTGAFIKPAMASRTLERRDSGLILESLVYQPGPFNPEIPGILRLEGTRAYRTSGATSSPRLRLGFGYLTAGGAFVQCFAASCANHVNRLPTIRATFDPDAGGLAARLARKITTVYIELQDLMIDLGDPAGPRVIPEQSRIPIVVKTDSWWSGTHMAVLDDTTHILGFRLYERIVGTSVADGVTDDLRASASSLDAASAATMRGLAQTVLDWLN